MPEPDQFVTLRSLLSGSLNDLVESSNLGDTGRCSLVCEIVSLFADYKEEGTPLFLDAFVTDNLTTLLKPIPQSQYLRLGTAGCTEDGIKKAVKATAPLVRDCWKMYICPDGSNMEYGVFRDSGHPFNVPIDLGLLPSGEAVENTKFLRIQRFTRDSVLVSNHLGRRAVIDFTNARPGGNDYGKFVTDLSAKICSDLKPPGISQSCGTYVASLISKAIRQSHGALIAVAKSRNIPAFLKDCTSLGQPISILKAVEDVRRDPATLSQLHALEALVCGMFNCDGVVVFNTKAEIIAYNAFVKLKGTSVVGGARRRAFEILQSKVGRGIAAAFYQSQDGATGLRSS